MEQDFFTDLLPEITINILSRLPAQTAVRCKCVRKSWRSLIETPEFVKSYKSVPSLAVFEGARIPYKVYELEDELNIEKFKNPCTVAFSFSLPQPLLFIQSSANGLLLLFDNRIETPNLVICNPVTQEYINLPDPFVPTRKRQFRLNTFGFGVSKTTGQYKLVGVFTECYDSFQSEIPEEVPLYPIDEERHCQVYTLGTGLWRTIAPSILLEYRSRRVGTFLNGNVHWVAYDRRGSPCISCFDLETELFSTFSPPHFDAIVHDDGHEATEDRDFCMSLFALRDCLGLSDHSRNQPAIWLMNTYGDENSWTKQFVIAKMQWPRSLEEHMMVLKVYEDGNIMIKRRYRIICYSKKTNTIQKTNLIQPHGDSSAVCYTPSFFQLKTFAMENVSSF